MYFSLNIILLLPFSFTGLFCYFVVFFYYLLDYEMFFFPSLDWTILHGLLGNQEVIELHPQSPGCWGISNHNVWTTWVE